MEPEETEYDISTHPTWKWLDKIPLSDTDIPHSIPFHADKFEWTDHEQSSEARNAPCMCKCNEISQKIMKLVIEMREILEERLPNMSFPQKVSLQRSGDWLPKKRFKSFRLLCQFNSDIENNFDMNDRLRSFFKSCGGGSAEQNIMRGLHQILSDSLARKCSLLGEKGNFAIGNMKWLQTLKDAVGCLYGTSDDEFQKIVHQWLRHANERYISKKAAKEKT